MNDLELYHHGVLGMHWGIRRYQPYPKGSSSKGKFVGKKTNAEKGSALNAKASRKLSQIDRKAEKKQNRADRLYNKAQKKEMSIFGSQKGVQKATVKATKAQRKVNKLEYKGSKYYKKISKKLNKLSVDIDPAVKERGEDFLRRSRENSKSIYNRMVLK